MKKKPSVAKLKKRAWRLFSIYIRLRDSDQKGFIRCYTCGMRIFWKGSQAGHFVPGRHNSILFDERGVHAQCYICNIHLHGNVLNYLDRMKEDYGQGVIDELRNKDKESKQFTAKELQELIEKIKEDTKRIWEKKI